MEGDNQKPMNIKIHQGFWTRDQVARDTESVYVFGDNAEDAYTNFYPSRTQAVIRGLSNSFGLVTKRNRGTSYSSYIYNSDLEYFKTVVEASIDVLKAYQEEGKTIVFPQDGIGTGKAMLKEKAPLCWEYLCKRLKEEFNYNNGQ